MDVSKFRLSRRSITLAVALTGMVSLAIGAHAALNKRALDAAKAIATEQDDVVMSHSSRLALVIGNGHYPDASAPLTQPINDARALAAALRRDGFAVDMVADASRDDMTRAVDCERGSDPDQRAPWGGYRCRQQNHRRHACKPAGRHRHWRGHLRTGRYPH